MVVIYPLTAGEDKTIRWAARIVPAAGFAIILYLGAVSVAFAAW